MNQNTSLLVLVGVLIMAIIVWSTTVLSAGLETVVESNQEIADSTGDEGFFGTVGGLLSSIVGIIL